MHAKFEGIPILLPLGNWRPDLGSGDRIVGSYVRREGKVAPVVVARIVYVFPLS